jgi:hypothetical protein
MATPTLERASGPEKLGVDGPLQAARRQPPVPPRRRLGLRRPSRRTLVELLGFAVLAVAYNLIRSGGGEGSAAAAVDHARDIIALEGWVFTHLEVPLNEWMVGITPVAVVACYVYALLHYAATPIVFFMSRRRGGWQYWRGYWALVLASAIALVAYALYPAAPPRLTPDLGVIDVMSHFSEFGWWGSAASAPRGIGDATNQYAAMPSMHFGWALWCAIQLWGFRRRIWRVLAVVYPTVLLVVVVGTGNHYLLDVVAGGAVVVAAYAVVEVVGRVVRARQGAPARPGQGDVTPVPAHLGQRAG